jgi:hypothetical protein
MTTHTIPTPMLEQIHAEVQSHGRRNVETGMFLLGRPDSEAITTLALAGKAGITRHREHFAVSGRALARLFKHARLTQLSVLAQIHSHAGAAFLSEVDLRHGFAVEGFTTCVVPNYRGPSRNPRAWGWWRHDGTVWQSAHPYAPSAGQSTTITFDEETIDAC